MITTKNVQIKDVHLNQMLDDTGILRRANFSLPDLKEGYATDDNGRLLIVACLQYKHSGSGQSLTWATRALSFLQYAERDGWFKNFMLYDRHFLDSVCSQECYGRCIWALGFAAAQKYLPKSLRQAAGTLLEKVAPMAGQLSELRACAYAAMGFLNWRHPDYRARTGSLLAHIASAWRQNAQPGWPWYEDSLSYCNAIIPHALLMGFRLMDASDLLSTGLESLRFLLEETTRDGFFWPIGSGGWAPRGGVRALYGQLPVEACCTLFSCITAHHITKDDYFLQKARLCLNWYLGHNSAGASMIDPDTGGCYDSLNADGPSPHQGAEALLSWYAAVLALRLYEGE
ncbi:MAG: hypothetical protein AB7V55_07170 [Oscillospiraceae bacterium]